MKDRYTFEEFCGIIDQLLGENGCPWDKEQTHESLAPNFLEECYEVIDAALNGDGTALCEELGDVLLHVVINSKMSEIDGGFSLADVVSGVSRKMIGRHPHIFKTPTALTSADVLNNWDDIKKKEKGYASDADALKRIPRAAPALVRAAKALSKAGKTSVDAPPASMSAEDALAEMGRLLDELRAVYSTNNDKIAALIGESLLTLTAFSTKMQINAEFALTNAIEQFINRFEIVEKRTFLLE
ncbi:MAG: MazG family protein [Clostridiales bacterium]|jgi:tetrapyrrole methylase family protein/MazG family protein|nr:MazG family protein [Clostridiales bacterium]